MVSYTVYMCDMTNVQQTHDDPLKFSRFGLHQLLTKTSGSSAANVPLLSPDSRRLYLPFGAEEEFKIKDRNLARHSRISSRTHPETISPEPLGGPEARCRQTDSLRCPPDLGCGSRYT